LKFIVLSRRQRAAVLLAGLVSAVTGGGVVVMTPVASAATTRYEAETAPATCDGSIETVHTGYSGSGFCDGRSAVGAAVQFTVDASSAGTATLSVRFANGSSGARPAEVVVNDKSTSASAFRSNLTSMINQVREKSGVPVLVTPPVRRQFSGNQLNSTALHVNGLGVNLPAEMRGLGSALNVPVIDLTAKSEALVESLGPTNSAQLYLRQAVDGVDDNTHFSEYGAGKMADLVVQGVRERNLSLVGYLR
jgi:hypothetical protein